MKEKVSTLHADKSKLEEPEMNSSELESVSLSTWIASALSPA
ncbi:hypothetical protein SAMD00020551_4830 [Mesobacillus selenatarsenatis SF-1]|uniref:Uncharacterized protein n=1 Tax=Mesobacillus selenatarsenatis (strain DSM 18680 / JCM 14380 / FERM P-15431 / SF-1) TaxID=1321606 RepID=A0A0A8XEM3_MESS1|nr:hypothetical protein SAMD00020551_4830 [Mesobacillus selenatarsenatis SF-1]